jgi:hypothetical protein
MNRAEIAQSVLDIKAFFSRNGAGKNLGSGASSASLQRLEKTVDSKLPFALSVLLEEVDGGLYFMERKQYSASEMVEKFMDLDSGKKWKAGLIPFCGDDSTVLVVDTNDQDAVKVGDGL